MTFHKSCIDGTNLSTHLVCKYNTIIHQIQMGLHELGETFFCFFLEMQEWLKFDTNSPILQMSQLDDLFHTSTTKQFMQIFGGCSFMS
jgi:hypothetical protein